MAGPMRVATHADIIDAEFETIRPGIERLQAVKAPAPIASVMAGDGLGILRAERNSGAAEGHPDGLTPTFLLFTAFAALVVFWVSGGHALLY